MVQTSFGLGSGPLFSEIKFGKPDMGLFFLIKYPKF